MGKISELNNTKNGIMMKHNKIQKYKKLNNTGILKQNRKIIKRATT